jgi:hypothetical protein
VSRYLFRDPVKPAEGDLYIQNGRLSSSADRASCPLSPRRRADDRRLARRSCGLCRRAAAVGRQRGAPLELRGLFKQFLDEVAPRA